MTINERIEQIQALVERSGYVSVRDLSEEYAVSEMTIRRDLQRLEEQKRLRRTFGGAVPWYSTSLAGEEESIHEHLTEGLLVDRVDVLITPSVGPKYDQLLLDRIRKKNIPVVAESLSMDELSTLVAVDNFQAAAALGRWVGRYCLDVWKVKPYVLDLTFRLSNTMNRSRGFLAGLLEVNPTAEVVLSIDAQSQFDTAYRLTFDALTVHKHINIIFSINDIMAAGAIHSCQVLGIDSNQVMVLTFGLEGDTLKDILTERTYCKAAVAMFPEIVAPTCVEAAILKYNQRILPPIFITPYAVVTPDTLSEYYEKTPTGWELHWETIDQRFELPLPLNDTLHSETIVLPHRIGFIVPFKEHEWYRNLTNEMSKHAQKYSIDLEIVDAREDWQAEIEFRRSEIARVAAQQITPGEVVILDEGSMSNYLAEALLSKDEITVITNSMSAFDILKKNPKIILILLGGIYRRSTQVLVGPTAESALRDLRADKLFLMVSGIALSFGLSHTNVSEVTIKQAMIRSAREVILLADHTFFDQEAVIQVAPLSVVNQIIIDDAIPASTRLELAKLGIQITLVVS